MSTSEANVLQLQQGGDPRPTGDLSFNEGLSLFLLFVHNNGKDADPTKADNPQLAQWAKTQHAEHSKYKKDKKSLLNEDSIKILATAGFTFKLNNNERWQKNRDIVANFSKEKGHTRVPRNCVVDGYKIGEWVHNQRKARKEGKKSLTDEKIASLDSIGFQWDLNDWEKMYNTLKAFHKQHGHCFVPRVYEPNKYLGRWVSYQRTLYNKNNDSNEMYITPARVQLLNDIGFKWD